MKSRLIGLTLFSALLLALALPNELFAQGNALLGLFCLAPFLLALILAPSFRFASLLGVIFGGLSTALANYWLLFFQEFSMWTLGGVVLGYMGYNALLAPFLYGLARISPRYRPFVLAATWALYEYLKSIGFLGYPWGLVAHPVHQILPLIQFIDITGIWGLSLLMALINALAAEGLLLIGHPWWGPQQDPKPARQRWLSQVAFCASLILLCLAYGALRLKAEIPYDTSLDVLLIQQNTDPWQSNGALRSVRVNQDLSRQGLRESVHRPDLTVWSETSVLYPLMGNEAYYEKRPREDPLLPFIRESGTYFLFGSPVVMDREAGRAMNSVLLVSPQGEVVDYYGKQHPVPMAESVPFWELQPVRYFVSEVIGLRAVWTMGSRSTIFELPLKDGRKLRFAAPICFEDAFADLCRTFLLRGADLWINLTDDSWSRTKSAEIQHYLVAKFRTVENRRVLIRSTNGGVTAVVGPKGEEIASLPLFTSNYLAVRVPIYKEKALTPYTRFGDYFPYVLMVLLLIQIVRRTFLAAGLSGILSQKSGRLLPKSKSPPEPQNPQSDPHPAPARTDNPQ